MQAEVWVLVLAVAATATAVGGVVVGGVMRAGESVILCQQWCFSYRGT
jgi:hypothetical protein